MSWISQYAYATAATMLLVPNQQEHLEDTKVFYRIWHLPVHLPTYVTWAVTFHDSGIRILCMADSCHNELDLTVCVCYCSGHVNGAESTGAFGRHKGLLSDLAPAGAFADVRYMGSDIP